MSITLSKAIRSLRSQGMEIDQNIICNLVKCVQPGHDLSPVELAQILIACASPDNNSTPAFVAERQTITNEQGRTFLDALTDIFFTEPAKLEVARVSICLDFPAAWISYLDGETTEFVAQDFSRSFRRECVLSGGLIASLCMKLHFASDSGWTGKEFDANGEPI